jgi:cyclase
MNQDGVKRGYDIEQLLKFKDHIRVPFIASGGAGSQHDFYEVFVKADVDGALAASVFHEREILIPQLKRYLKENKIEVRL